MEYPKYKDLNDSTCTSRVMRVRYPEFYQYIIENYPDCKFTEALYLFYNNAQKGVCLECGKPTKFYNLWNGYREFCSYTCSNKSDEVKKRREETCLKHFGTKSAMHSEQVKNKLKESNLLKYGVDNPSKSQEVKDKIKKTNLEKYGSESPLQNKEIMAKSIKTCMEKYGAKCYGCSQEAIEHKRSIKNQTREKMLRTKYKNMIENNEELLDYDGNIFTRRCPDPNCNKCSEKYYKIPNTVYYARKSNNIDVCTTRTPLYASSNTNIEKFIRNLLDDNNISYISNDRTILNGKELDIYIPDKNIAIECNGVYWHSLKEHDYHYKKWKTCEEKGIQLLTIWEDWISLKPEIIKSLVLSKLGIYKERYGARECDIREVPVSEARDFLIKNHIQGVCNSKIKLGLYKNDRLLCLMTFGKARNAIMSNKNEKGWELLRFCTERGVQVIGGATKLLDYFIEQNHPDKIITFASHDISNGKLYENLKFQKGHESISSYWYINKNTLQRFHRSSFTKKNLVKQGYDPSLTEEQIMMSTDYLKIYDSGLTKYVLS